MLKREFKLVASTEGDESILVLQDQFNEFPYGIVDGENEKFAEDLKDLVARAYDHSLNGLDKEDFPFGMIELPEDSCDEQFEMINASLEVAHLTGDLDRTANTITEIAKKSNLSIK